MQTISTILTFLTAALGIIGFIWMIIGNIPGIILLVLALRSKDSTKKKQYFKWMWIAFGGLLLVIAAIILQFLVAFTSTLFGLTTSIPSLPTQP